MANDKPRGVPAKDTEYLQSLENERSSLGDPFNLAVNLLDKEIERVKSGKKESDSVSNESKQPKPAEPSPNPHLDVTNDKYQKVIEKVSIPTERYPKVNFIGKLLGPKGVNMRQLQDETMTRISIYGRGSIRDKAKEEELRKEGGKFAHLSDKLHVHIEAYAEPSEAHSRIAHALAELRKFLIPTEEEIAGGGGPPRHGESHGGGGGFENGRGRGRGGVRGRGGLLGSDPARGGRGGGLDRGRGGMDRGRGLSDRGRGAPRGGTGGAPRGGSVGAPRGGSIGAPRGGSGGAPIRGSGSSMPMRGGRGGERGGYDDGYGRGGGGGGGGGYAEEYDEVPKRSGGYNDAQDDGYGYGSSGYSGGRDTYGSGGDRGGYGGGNDDYSHNPSTGYGDTSYGSANDSYSAPRAGNDWDDYGSSQGGAADSVGYGAPRQTSTPAVRGRGGGAPRGRDEYGRGRGEMDDGRESYSGGYSGGRGGGGFKAGGARGDNRSHPYGR